MGATEPSTFLSGSISDLRRERLSEIGEAFGVQGNYGAMPGESSAAINFTPYTSGAIVIRAARRAAILLRIAGYLRRD